MFWNFFSTLGLGLQELTGQNSPFFCSVIHSPEAEQLGNKDGKHARVNLRHSISVTGWTVCPRICYAEVKPPTTAMLSTLLMCVNHHSDPSATSNLCFWTQEHHSTLRCPPAFPWKGQASQTPRHWAPTCRARHCAMWDRVSVRRDGFSYKEQKTKLDHAASYDSNSPEGVPLREAVPAPLCSPSGPSPLCASALAPARSTAAPVPEVQPSFWGQGGNASPQSPRQISTGFNWVRYPFLDQWPCNVCGRSSQGKAWTRGAASILGSKRTMWNKTGSLKWKQEKKKKIWELSTV